MHYFIKCVLGIKAREGGIGGRAKARRLRSVHKSYGWPRAIPYARPHGREMRAGSGASFTTASRRVYLRIVMRILFIDDDELIRECMYETLSDMGHDVVVEDDGERAVELFRENPHGFDLVLTDLLMLGMTGDRVLEKIASIPPCTPIVVMTGTPGYGNPQEGRGRGNMQSPPETSHEDGAA